MRVAVVDIGTNSTRLLIADVNPGAAIEERVRESTVTRLGEGVEATGRLGDEPQRRVFATLERYAAEIRAQECEASAAVMTSAVRDAANGAELSAAVRERYGLDGRTLSGHEEAAFTYAGATAARPPDDPTELVVIDIGGGSTELVCGAGGRLGFHVSTQIGVVRHTERHLRADPPARDELARLAADVRAGIEAAVPAQVRDAVGAAVAVAGTATSCAAMDLRLEPYDAARVEGHRLERGTLEDLLDRVAALPLGERPAVPGLHPDRAPTIVAGIVILLEALDAFGVANVEVSERDILWGVALQTAGAPAHP
jgi:exopolyphosphatase / guanosine-5'-triphosphate,3'-diphosphate pyrophosphatase